MSEPMEFHPMGPVEIALTTFRVYFRTLPIMIGIGVLPLGIVFAAILVVSILPSASGFVEENISVIFIGYIIIQYVVILYYYAAATLVLSLHLTGHKAGLFQVLKRISVTLVFQILGTGILIMLVILGGLILLIIPGIIFMIWFIFAAPIVVLERVSYARAMRRSRELVKNHWWRIFISVLFVVVLIQIVINGTPFILSYPLTAVGLNEYSFGISFILMLIFYPLQVIFPVLLYYDIRIRKEALNITTLRETL